MKTFKRLGAVSLAAALMATTMGIYASADDYAITGTVEYSDFGAQLYGMGTTNWSWATGGQGYFEAADDKGTLSISAKGADMNTKGDDIVQFGLQFYLGTDSKGNGELAIGDSYTATVTYKITAATGTIKEETVEISKEVAKNQWGAGIEGSYTLYSAEIPKADLEAYGDISATVELSNVKFVKDGKEGTVAAAAEETTAAEEEVVEETNAAADTEEETTEAPAEEEAEEEWVSTFDAASVKIDEDQAPYFDGLQFALRADNEAQASLESDFGFDITSVYGIRVNVEVDPADVEHGVWYGGSVGANCPSRGWGQHNFANGDGDELTFVESDGSITWQLDEPIFSEDDGYAFAFFQSWGGPIGVKSFELLDKDGNVIDYEAAAVETAVDADADTVNETVEAVEDANKANPNTGVADVAVVAGLAVAAAGAAVIAKKRK